MAAGVFFVIRVRWNHPNDLPLAKWQQTSERPFSHTSWLPKTTVFPTHPKNKQANAKQALPFPTVFFHRSPFLALQKLSPFGIPGNSGEPRGWMIQQVAITSSGCKGLGGKASSCPTNSKAPELSVGYFAEGCGGSPKSGLGLQWFHTWMTRLVNIFLYTPPKSHQKLTSISKMMVFEKNRV